MHYYFWRHSTLLTSFSQKWRNTCNFGLNKFLYHVWATKMGDLSGFCLMDIKQKYCFVCAINEAMCSPRWWVLSGWNSGCVCFFGVMLYPVWIWLFLCSSLSKMTGVRILASLQRGDQRDLHSWHGATCFVVWWWGVSLMSRQQDWSGTRFIQA